MDSTPDNYQYCRAHTHATTRTSKKFYILSRVTEKYLFATIKLISCLKWSHALIFQHYIERRGEKQYQ